MGIVQRIPRGYLSLIGAQTSGRNPDVATEEVRPTIDMTRYYDGYFVDFESLSFVANAAGVTHNIDVPAAETWILLGMSMTGNVNLVADRVYFSAGFNLTPMNPGGIGLLWSGELSGKVTSGVPILMVDAITLPYPIALQGGSQVAVHIDDRNASPTCLFQAIILRLSG